MVWIVPKPNEVEALKELETVSDRAAAILTAAIVDDRLQMAIARKVQGDNKSHEQLFRPMGVLGSFSAKIAIGYAMGLYSEGARKDLNYIRDIRNDFAHKASVRSFSDQSIRAKCMNIKHVEKHVLESRDSPKEKYAGAGTFMIDGKVKEKLADPRRRYIMASYFYVMALQMLAKSGRPTFPTNF